MNKIIITIETLSREFDYKIYIARELAKFGFEVHIVECDYYKLVLIEKSKDYLLLDKVLLDYKTNQIRLNYLDKLKYQGVKLIYLNEESAVFKNYDNVKIAESELKSMYDISVFNEDNIVVSAGDFQHNFALNKSPKCEMALIGIPRFSLYSNDYKYIYNHLVSDVLNKYGDFILINTNYSLFNPATGLNDVFLLNNPENNISFYDTAREITLSYLAEGRQVFGFIELILQLSAKYPQFNFVLRPHPSENPEYYNFFFQGLNNVFVNNSGSVNELILASKALIHNGCTTAIESSLAGIPVFNYDLIGDSKYICAYPNEFGNSFYNLKDFLFHFDNFVLNLNSNYSVRLGNKDFLKNINDNSNSLNNYIALILRTLNSDVLKKGRLRYSIVGLLKLYILIPFFNFFRINILGESKLGKYFNSKRKFPGFKKQTFKLRYTMLNFHHQDKIKVKILNNYHMKITNK